ncbi:MAG: HupE/UreJ family protein [Deltaproteobacteria bacterium]|nr:HupE/UreJ family protein [Deltaproteobacteria bacterium]
MPHAVLAHTRSQSFSSWYIHDGQVRLSFSVQSLEATRLGALEDKAADLNEVLVRHLASHLRVRANGEECRTAAGPQAHTAREGYLRVEWRFVCPTNQAIEIVNNAFFAVASSHVHYARVRVEDRRPIEYLFTNTERRRVLTTGMQAPPDSSAASFVSYLWLGVEHILIGLDHLAFLVALLLLCRRLREVALMVTGFTAGHSLTLSLAALGVVTLHIPVIEALIGFTIALVAAENIGVATSANRRIAAVAGAAFLLLAIVKVFVGLGLPIMTLVGLALFTACYLLLIDTQTRAVRWRPVLTLLFGLIHGFGFASVLLEIGLPTDRLVAALFGFNLGVEIGQLGIVAVCWGIGRMLVHRYPASDYGLAIHAASAALCALGLFWFVGRSLS